MTGRGGVRITADILLDEAGGSFDALVLPGGPGFKILGQSPRVLETVRMFHGKGLLCCAICAAPWVLSEASILKGRAYTCYPGIEKDIPDARYLEQEVVQDGTIITSAGPGTAVPFALAVIGALTGSEKAAEIKKQIVFSG